MKTISKDNNKITVVCVGEEQMITLTYDANSLRSMNTKDIDFNDLSYSIGVSLNFDVFIPSKHEFMLAMSVACFLQKSNFLERLPKQYWQQPIVITSFLSNEIEGQDCYLTRIAGTNSVEEDTREGRIVASWHAINNCLDYLEDEYAPSSIYYRMGYHNDLLKDIGKHQA